MAKFGINKEGVAALRQLEKDLKSINTEIETSGKTLKAAVSGIGEGLGIYEEKILELDESVRSLGLSKETYAGIDNYISAVNTRWLKYSEFMYRYGVEDVLALLR